MRLEKPHSLSYHDITRTSVPFSTLVWSIWNVDECGSWLKSIETLGAVRRREGVVDPDVAELCQFGDKARIVLFLLCVEAGVFQTKDIAVLHGGDGLLRDIADAIIGDVCLLYTSPSPRD